MKRTWSGGLWGLFVASALLFLLGGLHARLAQPVLIYLLTFMLGFAMGRLTSVVVDGVPSVFVVLLLGLEVLYSAVAAWALYTNRNMTVPSRSEGTNENGTF